MLEMCLMLISEESDKEKFERLYYTYKDMMFKLAMSILHNHVLAEETVQDCMLKLAEIIAKVPDVQSKSTKAMIVIMVKNKAKNNIKLEHYNDIEPINDNDDYISDRIVSEIVTDSGYKKILQAIMELDSIYRDVLVLKFIHGFSTIDIAELLKIPIRTVETRIYRSRKILKDKLEEMFDEYRV